MLLDGFHNDELVLLCEIQQADNYGKQIQLNGTDEMTSKPSKRSYLSRKTEYKIPRHSRDSTTANFDLSNNETVQNPVVERG